MPTISKLHDKCQKCKYKDDCDEKRMVACAIAKLPPSPIQDMGMSASTPLSMPISREYTPITINMGDIKIGTSLEEISKKIEEDFYKHLRCGFNETL